MSSIKDNRTYELQDIRKFTVGIKIKEDQTKTKEDRILGTGVIVTSDGMIVTCFHVVGDVKTKVIHYKSVDVFYATNPNIIKAASVLEEYSNPSLDIAVLKLQDNSPDMYDVAVLKRAIYPGNPFSSFGFRKERQFRGLYSTGEIRGETYTKATNEENNLRVIQLYSDEIEPGMSGAPVLDMRIGAVVGIILAVYRSGSGYSNLSFAIPVSSIVEVCPILEEKNPGLVAGEQTSEAPRMGPVPPITAKWTTKNELLTHIATDQWTIHDTLGYDPYAYAMAKFLTNEQTEAPISISIQAPWGGGKTSLMRMVRYMVDKDAPESSTREYPAGQQQERVKLKLLKETLKNSKREKKHHPEPKSPESIRRSLEPRLTIWFNAWKYESTEQVWAGLADSIVKGFADRMSVVEREWFYLRLNLRRRDIDSIRSWISDHTWNYVWKKAGPWIWTSVIGLGTSLLIGATEWTVQQSIFANGGILGSIGFGGLGIIQTLSKKIAVEEEPADVSLGEFVKVPDYNEKLGFIHHVVRDLELVFETIPSDFKEKPIIIFIDDLDRCSPTKVAQVIEGVNLFLARKFPSCIFVIGMDAEMVAAALEVAHKDVILNLPSYSTDIP